MVQVQIFQSPKFGEIRVQNINGKLMFIASDVAKALGYALPQKAVATHCKHCSKMEHWSNKGTKVAIIPESDVYRLVLKSKLPEAELFQDWIVEEVLPSIRQTGSYTSLLAKSRESREDGVYDSDYPTLEDYFRKYVPAEYFVNMLFSIMKEYSSMADILPEEADNAYHKVSVLLTFTNTLAANHRRGAFA